MLNFIHENAVVLVATVSYTCTHACMHACTCTHSYNV